MPAGPRLIELDDGRGVTVLGNQLLLKVTGAESGGAFELYQQTNLPGTGVPPHVHTLEDETFFVVSGMVRFQVGRETIDAGPGTTLVAPRDVPHSYQIIGDRAGVLLFIVSPPNLAPMFADLGALRTDPPDFAKAAEICGRFGIRFTTSG